MKQIRPDSGLAADPAGPIGAGAARRPMDSPAFVGRPRALAVLHREFGRAVRGAPGVVWISGVPGIGKTRLVRRFLTEVGGGAAAPRVATASADEAETGLSYGIVAQISAQLGGFDGPPAEVVPDPRAPLVPAGAGSPASVTGAGSAGSAAGASSPIDAGAPAGVLGLLDRSGAGGAAAPEALAVGADLLAALGSGTRPTVLVLDDWQWSDPESAQAMLFVLRRLRAEPLLVVIVSQPDLAHRLGAGWYRLLDDPARVTPVELTGMPPADLIRLARAVGHREISGSLARRLHEHTGGHPLYARAILEQQDLTALGASPEPLPVPDSFAAVIRSRVAALRPDTRDLLAAGAVLGAPFAPAPAAELAGVTRTGAALDEAADAGLVQLRPGGDVEFAHALVHAAVYHGLPLARRHDLHRAAGRLTSGAVSLRHRVAATTGFDADLATELATLGVRDLDQGRYHRAAEHFERASRFAAVPEVRERLLLAAVSLTAELGDSPAAEAHRAAVEACAPSPARALCLGLMAFAAGRLADAGALLTEVLDDGPGVTEPQRSRASAGLAFCRMMQGDWTRSLEAADTALAGSLPWERAMAMAAAAYDLAMLGRMGDARERLDRIAAAHVGPAGSVDLLIVSGLVALLDDDLDAAVADLTAAVRRARAGEQARLLALALTQLAEAEYFLGRWDDALLHTELALATATESAHLGALAHAHAVACWIGAARGHLPGAATHLDALRSIPGSGQSWIGRRLSAMAAAVLAEHRGDRAAALAELDRADRDADPAVRDADPAVRDADAAGPDIDRAMTGLPAWRLLATEALVASAVAGGQPDRARRAASAFAEWAAARGPRWRDDAARFTGLAAAAGGDPDAAQQVFDRRLAEPPPWPGTLARGRLHEEAGRLLAQRGRRREAVRQLRAAREIYADLRAAPAVQRCDAALAGCGLPAQGSERDPLLLTDAEARVARLVSQGLANREVAERLFISIKTVEYHLGHVYAKLGVTSRAQLARVLAPGARVPV